MLLHLPLLRATLRPCSETWAAMPATATGRYCSRCEHTVHDFSALADPTAALAAAQAASPTGRVCGRFVTTLVARPQLRPRLRRFVVALVLVFGLGLPAHEALAQVRRAAAKPSKVLPHRPQHRPVGARAPSQPIEVPKEEFLSGDIVALEPVSTSVPQDTVLTYVEQMPALPSGTAGELRAYYSAASALARAQRLAGCQRTGVCAIRGGKERPDTRGAGIERDGPDAGCRGRARGAGAGPAATGPAAGPASSG